VIDRDQLEAAVAQADPPELLQLAGELQGRAFRLTWDRTTEAPVEDALLTMPEVAKRLGCSEDHARTLGRTGELPTVQVGRFVRVRASALERWIRTNEAGGR